MIRKFLAIILFSILSSSIVMAQAEQCGDGDQRYSGSKHGDTVRYFADVNEFNITRVSEEKVIVEDQVKCRYGRDSLFNIETVVFLDEELTVDELVIHEKQKQLSLAVLKSFLYDKVAAQISSKGVNPFKEESGEETTTTTEQLSSDQENTSSTGSRFIPNSSSAITSSYTPGQFNANNTTNTYRSNSTASYSSYTPGSYGSSQQSYGSAYPNTYSNSYSAYNSYGNNASGYNQNYMSGGVSNASAGTVVATWSRSQVSNNEIIYFEARDSDNQHHYLGSAVGYQGSKPLDIPSFLADEEKLTIYVKSGGRLIKTFDVEL